MMAEWRRRSVASTSPAGALQRRVSAAAIARDGMVEERRSGVEESKGGRSSLLHQARDQAHHAPTIVIINPVPLGVKSSQTF
jgi:hypothetical protein